MPVAAAAAAARGALLCAAAAGGGSGSGVTRGACSAPPAPHWVRLPSSSKQWQQQAAGLRGAWAPQPLAGSAAAPRQRARAQRVRAMWGADGQEADEAADYYAILDVPSTASTDEIKVGATLGVGSTTTADGPHPCAPRCRSSLDTCPLPLLALLPRQPRPANPTTLSPAVPARPPAPPPPPPPHTTHTHTHPTPPLPTTHPPTHPPTVKPQRAYRRLAKEFHPDVSADESNTEFQMFLNDVYQVGGGWVGGWVGGPLFLCPHAAPAATTQAGTQAVGWPAAAA